MMDRRAFLGRMGVGAVAAPAVVTALAVRPKVQPARPRVERWWLTMDSQGTIFHERELRHRKGRVFLGYVELRVTA